MKEIFFICETAVCFLLFLLPGRASFAQDHPKAIFKGPARMIVDSGKDSLKVSADSLKEVPGKSELVAVGVTVDSAGNVINAGYQTRGSTTSSEAFVKLALAYVHRLKFSPGDSISEGTVTIRFRVHS